MVVIQNTAGKVEEFIGNWSINATCAVWLDDRPLVEKSVRGYEPRNATWNASSVAPFTIDQVAALAAFYGPQQVENWEGCLSVDGLRGKVTRPSLIRVTALDRQGKPLDFEATGLFAVCIQHEMDHLIGKLFLDRMTNMSTLTQLAEFDQYWKKDPAAVI